MFLTSYDLPFSSSTTRAAAGESVCNVPAEGHAFSNEHCAVSDSSTSNAYHLPHQNQSGLCLQGYISQVLGAHVYNNI